MRSRNLIVFMLFISIMAVFSCGTDNSNVVNIGEETGRLTVEDGEKINDALGGTGTSGMQIDLNVKIKIPKKDNPYATEDGELWATVIRPKGGEKLPTIFQITCYGREIMMMFSLGVVGRDYNFIVVDFRGTGSSGGPWASFGMAEQYDTRYIIDKFIPAQEWSDGRVGMIGGSYEAISQFLAAGLVDIDKKSGEPTHLKAIFPKAPMADAAGDIAMHGGMLDLLFVPAWIGIVDFIGLLPPMLTLGVDGKVTKEYLAEASDIVQDHWNYIPTTVGWVLDPDVTIRGDFLDERSPMMYWPQKPEGGWCIPEGNTNTISNKLPVFETGGWYCIFTRGTMNYYTHGLKNHSTSDKKMIIGEYYHIEAATGMGNNAVISGKLPLRWFDWKIKGKDDPFMEEFPVLLFAMGENKWRAEKSWPLPESRLDKKTLYLTKKVPTPIEDDWYTDTDEYEGHNYGMSETPDYEGENPVISHRPIDPVQGINLHGGNSREVARWFFGFPAVVPDLYKWYMDNNFVPEQYYEDERHNEKEGLTFTTEPLEEDTNITGPLSLTFWATTEFTYPLTTTMVKLVTDFLAKKMNIEGSSVMEAILKKDVQWISSLNDVFPGGRARNITMGWLSAWTRQYDPAGTVKIVKVDGENIIQNEPDPDYVPFDPFYFGPGKNPKPIKEGELYRYTIELWPTCNTFKKGHRIRLSLLNSDFPHLLATFQASRSTIVIDADHPAKLEFKTTNTDGEGVTWKMIGDNEAADSYLLDGQPTGCGSAATASVGHGRSRSLPGLDLPVIIMVLMGLIYGRRRRNRK